MTYISALIPLAIGSLLTLSCALSHAAPIELPTIGRLSNTTIAEEERIGAAWLKQYRRHVSTSTDPIITYYLENLLARLDAHIDTNYSSLSLVVAKNSSLNAFAVPGGVVGVHTGLLRYAKTEPQLASVLAHELAHLSQRHFARGQEKQKSQSITTIAGLLASLVLAATTEGDAAIAAFSTSQAYAIDQQLRFSRSFEQEADRIGLSILVKAGLDPHATEDVFEQMDRITRFSSLPPEYLLTHPLTDTRIVDAINLARNYPKQVTPENINYQFVRARALLDTEDSPQQAIIRFRNELSGFDTSIDSSRYGLAIALNDNQEYDEAAELLRILLKKYPENRILLIAYSTALAGQGKSNEAIKSIQVLRQQHPSYYPLALQLSDLYRSTRDYKRSSELLEEATKTRLEDPSIWYELAEVAGLNNNISLLNKARAEFFILYANFANAEQQLRELLKREKAKKETTDFHTYATARLQELDTLRKQAKL